MGVAILPIQWPCDEVVDLFEVFARFVGDVSHDGVDRFRLGVAFLAFDDIFCRNTSL
jgi:hypothetical protein